MNVEDFKQLLDERKRSHPIWFELPSDRLASQTQILEAQQALGLQLPADYAWFLKECGGGYFALAMLYSLDSSSDFHLVQINRAHQAITGRHLLFSENGCGDFYGFRIESRHCLAPVEFFDHSCGQWQTSRYNGLLSFLAEVALSN
ncbi:SMI1/KNR4 family protein [Pseudomonas protegens]|uniref:SMI1/KNR4 family protein n=1 Tax=Pseudomonas protegens TaxID=380021 RepID=UPI001B33B430|nr:SMI1/KNR4 family protein [Pseudomonas protegens]MBP5106427.1 SMI1/KNR4 family protein [Pseudomonas protegens]MBP5132442.1 SMI1/KNR4 family protein [Pseudomonas protegens]MBP5149209.1 SMI1/KNR4 family protein [Pseudomonas protegens]